MRDVLRRVAGDDIFLEESERKNYAVPGSLPVVVAPYNAEQAATIMSTAQNENWAVLCAGAGTRLDRVKSGRKIDIVMATRRMTNIAEYEPADLVITVQAGVTLAQIGAATRRHNQFLALDPPVDERSSAGGIVATAAAGPFRFTHGTPRDHVLGLQLVTGDARVVHFGGKVVKNVAGYDVVRPIVGSRGTLGLITEVSLRLKPLPEADETVLIRYDSFDDAADFRDAVIAANLDIVALEILSPGLAGELDGSGWTVIARLHGNSAAVRDSTEHVRRLARPEVTQASERAWHKLARVESEAPWIVRAANLPSELRETAAAAERIAKSAMDGAAYIAIHAGDGIARILANDASSAFDEIVRHERGALEARGGSLIVARAARPFDDMHGKVNGLDLMAGVQRVFDPASILAPQSFVV